MYWQNPAPADGKPAGRRQMYGNAIIDPATGEDIAARDTLGGEFFYRLHFDLHYVPVVWARYSVGLCAMFMLVAIISGVITHKKIFTDFFTFRPGKGLRSWLEFHNVSAVTALPYHAMITDTGVVTLMFMYLPWGIKARYAGDDMRFHDEAANRVADTRTAAGVPAHMLPLEQFVTRTRSDWRGGDVGSVAVSFPNDAHAAVGVTQLAEHLSTDAPSILFDAVNGERLQRTGPPGGASQTRGVMVGLHLAHFAGAWLRASFFGSGLLGCLMVASGVVMWAVKERPKQLKAGRIGFGLRLVDALTIGTVAGLPVAFASFFWANRVLPVSLEARTQMEANAIPISSDALHVVRTRRRVASYTTVGGSPQLRPSLGRRPSSSTCSTRSGCSMSSNSTTLMSSGRAMLWKITPGMSASRSRSPSTQLRSS